METNKLEITGMEKNFLSLPGGEREAIISLGATLRLSYLKKRLFLAENKIKQFEQQYDKTLSQIEDKGLPDDAGYQMHEAYIMWSHWAEVVDKVKQDIQILEKITRQGLIWEENFRDGC